MGLWPVRPAELHSAARWKNQANSTGFKPVGRTDWKSMFQPIRPAPAAFLSFRAKSRNLLALSPRASAYPP
jgi:hypothetical protein